MRTLVGIGLVVVALGSAAWWLAGTSEGTRGRLARPGAAGSSEISALSPAEVPLPSVPMSAAREPAPPLAPDVPSALAEELARASWIEGRVVLPKDTPADEELFVVARGREFTDGRDQRARVAPDGTFRVAFKEETRVGHFELEARYLHLRPFVPWRLTEAGQPIVLEPRLGARLAGRLTLPPGCDPIPIGGTLELRSVSADGARTGLARREVGAQLAFAFDALALDGEGTCELVYRGDRFVGETAGIVLEPGRTTEVELALRPAVTLSGRVRDASGWALAGVRVSARALHASGEAAWARHAFETSAEDGTFRLGGLDAGTVVIRVAHEGFEDLELELGVLEPGETRADLELVLGQGPGIAGSVRWPDGSPARAQVRLVPLRQDMAWDSLPEALELECAPDGAFSASGLSAAEYRVTAFATHVEKAPVASEATGLVRAGTPEARWIAELARVPVGSLGLVLTLVPGLALDGLVADELGLGLSSFRVEAQRVESLLQRAEHGLGGSYREASGAFRLEGFTPGEWRVTVESSGHAPATERVEIPTAGPVRFVLARQAVVSGIVVDPTGAPVPRALVALAGSEPFGPPTKSEERPADVEGRFELDGLAPGTTILRARALGMAPSEPVVLELASGQRVEGLRLVLRAGGTILGEVLGLEGAPLAGARVHVTTTGFDDHVKTRLDGGFHSTGVPPGEVRLSVRLREGITLEETVHLAAGETRRVRLAPPTEIVRLTGRVLAAGEPLAEATLDAFKHDADGTDAPRYSNARTNQEGGFELILPGPGSYYVRVHQRGRASLGWNTTVEAPPVPSFRFDLAIPLGGISGHVQDTQGQPLAEMMVRSTPEGPDTEGSGWTSTDAEGRYELRVPAGRHTVRVGADAGSTWVRGRRLFAEARVEGVLVAEDDHVPGVDFQLVDGGALGGIVLQADGSPASRTFLWCERNGRLEVLGSCDGEGRFELQGLPVGPLRLRAERGQHASRTLELQIAAGATQRVRIELSPATTVHLSLRRGGEPIACEVSVIDREGARQPAYVRGDGEVWLGPLVAGRYTVRAQRDGKTVERSFEVAPGGPELALELVFE